MLKHVFNIANFIKTNGTSTTTAEIPFAQGLSVPDDTQIVYGDADDGTDEWDNTNTVMKRAGNQRFTDDVEFQGEITGKILQFHAGNRGNVTSSRYATGINSAVMDADIGHVMPWAGSIIGLSCHMECSSYTSSGLESFAVQARVNGSSVFSTFQTVTAVGHYHFSTTQARGTDTFSADDAIQMYYQYPAGGVFTLRNFLVSVYVLLE